MSGQATGGTRRHFLTVAIFRSWRGSKGYAAPGLPGGTDVVVRADPGAVVAREGDDVMARRTYVIRLSLIHI